jgi:hypothetical protein
MIRVTGTVFNYRTTPDTPVDLPVKESSQNVLVLVIPAEVSWDFIGHVVFKCATIIFP